MTWEELWGIILNFLTTTGIKLVVALLLVIIGFFITNKLTKGIKSGKIFRRVDNGVRGFLASFAAIVLKVLIVLTAVAYMGVPMTSVVAAIGSCGLAVGLALQGSLANLAGGILILAFKPFQVGDFVDADGVSGTVTSVTVLYTHVLTADGLHVVIPNGELSNAKVVNYSIENTRRMDIQIGASYDSAPETVRKVLLDVAMRDDRVLKSPAPVVNVASYDSSEIVYTLRMWANTDVYWDVHNETKNMLKAEFDKAGIEMAFPQLDVHIDR